MAKNDFNSYFYQDNGILDSTMNHIQGKMQAEASLEESEELEESFFQLAMRNILTRKAKNISEFHSVSVNKTYSKFSTELNKFCQSTLRIQPDFIIKDKNGSPLSVIELKSIFGSGTTKAHVLKDVARLALYKKLFPNCQCVLVIAGEKSEMVSFFKKSFFKFDNNVVKRVTVPYSWKNLNLVDLGLSDKDYIKAFKALDIREVQVKLSRTQYGQKYHSMSYVVRNVIPGYRPASDFIKTSWNGIESGDIVSIGFYPDNNIGNCLQVDKIDIALEQVMFLTNDVDDQDWTEIYLDDIVWKYSPEGNRI